MDIARLFQHYLNARQERIVLSFMGVVTQEIIVDYGKIVREQQGLTENSRQCLFGTFIELAQNILRYSAERGGTPPHERGIGLVIVSEAADTFTVTSGNMVRRPDADRLSAELSQLASIDREGLKALARDRRRHGPPPGSLGAGLGLIELARRAAGPLEQNLMEHSAELVFFSISVPVAKA